MFGYAGYIAIGISLSTSLPAPAVREPQSPDHGRSVQQQSPPEQRPADEDQRVLAEKLLSRDLLMRQRTLSDIVQNLSLGAEKVGPELPTQAGLLAATCAELPTLLATLQQPGRLLE